MNYLNEFICEHFRISYDTSASIIITLFVFCSGIILSKINTLYSKSKNRKILKRLIFNLVPNILKSSNKQAEYFISFSKSLNLEHMGSFTLRTITIELLDEFNSIGIINFQKTFLDGIENKCNQKIKSKAIFKLFFAISNIHKLSESYLEVQNKFESHWLKNTENRNLHIDNFRKIHDNLISKTTGKKLINEVDFEFISSLDKIYFDWQQLGDTQPIIIHRELVLKILKLNMEYAKKVTEDVLKRYIQNSNDTLLAASLSLQNMELLLDDYSEIFKSYGVSIKNSRRLGLRALKVLYHA